MQFKSLAPKDTFLRCALLFWAFGAFLMLATDKGAVVLWINDNHSTFGDFFFKYFTHVGDGLALALIGILLYFKKFYPALFFTLSGILAGLLAQLLKRSVFKGWPRPVAYFEHIDLNLVEGVKINHFETFPSGHTAAGFAMAFSLFLIFNKTKYTGILFFIVALLIGASRIYLAQHFFIDTYFGSLLGVLGVFLAQFITKKIIQKKPNSKAYFNPSIVLHTK